MGLQRQGGGIFGDTNSNITVLQSNLSVNNAARAGGGLYGSSNSTITVLQSNLFNNTAVRSCKLWSGALLTRPRLSQSACVRVEGWSGGGLALGCTLAARTHSGG